MVALGIHGLLILGFMRAAAEALLVGLIMAVEERAEEWGYNRRPLHQLIVEAEWEQPVLALLLPVS
jgi:ABC-type phosphate transport system permease subunit